jgi:hypothetical protein
VTPIAGKGRDGFKCLVVIEFILNSVLTLLNTELNPIRRLLALLGAHRILHVSRIGVKQI